MSIQDVGQQVYATWTREVHVFELAQEDHVLDDGRELIRRSGPNRRVSGRSEQTTSVRGGSFEVELPASLPSGVLTTTCSERSMPSTVPRIRLVSPRNWATNSSAGRS